MRQILTRREILTHLGLGFAMLSPLAVGCNHTPIIGAKADPPPATPAKQPDPASLVNYLNQNAQRVQTIRAKIDMDCKADRQSIALGGQMACQKPRDFRLKAMVLGQPAVDIGSNDQEFWYWISKAEPPHVYKCSYTELAKGKVRTPFPFQPDMVLTALGVAEYDPKGTYQIKASPKTLELIQDTVSPTGQPVKKITVFNRMVSQPGQPQVLAHVLRDSKGGLICQAHIHKVQVDRGTGAVLPTKVTIEWPSQKITMKMDLSDVQVNVIDKALASRLFQRADLNNLSVYDLALGTVDAPGGLQRTAPSCRDGSSGAPFLFTVSRSGSPRGRARNGKLDKRHPFFTPISLPSASLTIGTPVPR